MKILKKIPACCAVVALHYVSGIEEETVLRTCLLHGFIEGSGMEDYEWQAAADDLGIKIRHVSIEPQRLKVFLKNHAIQVLFLFYLWCEHSTRMNMMYLDYSCRICVN